MEQFLNGVKRVGAHGMEKGGKWPQMRAEKLREGRRKRKR